MKVLIIEDEALAAEKLVRLLKHSGKNIEVAGLLESVEQSVNWFLANPSPDLVFMDIQLDDGICFEIFEAVKIEAPVIFTTAYDEYAIRAFKVNSVDYLLKPVSAEALGAALEKYDKLFGARSEINENVARAFGQMGKTYKTRFLIKVGARFQPVPASEVSCFFVEARSVFLKTSGSRDFCLDYSLDQIQKMVDPGQFFRINRNYIVSIGSIADILSYSASRLKLRLNVPTSEELIVSREKVAEFKEWLDR